MRGPAGGPAAPGETSPPRSLIESGPAGWNGTPGGRRPAGLRGQLEGDLAAEGGDELAEELRVPGPRRRRDQHACAPPAIAILSRGAVGGGARGSGGAALLRMQPCEAPMRECARLIRNAGVDITELGRG